MARYYSSEITDITEVVNKDEFIIGELDERLKKLYLHPNISDKQFWNEVIKTHHNNLKDSNRVELVALRKNGDKINVIVKYKADPQSPIEPGTMSNLAGGL